MRLDHLLSMEKWSEPKRRRYIGGSLESSTFVVQFSVTEEWVILTKASPILTGIFPLVLLQ